MTKIQIGKLIGIMWALYDACDKSKLPPRVLANAESILAKWPGVYEWD